MAQLSIEIGIPKKNWNRNHVGNESNEAKIYVYHSSLYPQLVTSYTCLLLLILELSLQIETFNTCVDIYLQEKEFNDLMTSTHKMAHTKTAQLRAITHI